MAPFLKGHRKGHHIFEVSTTCLYLRRALQVLYYTASQGGQILFMGKSPKVSGITKGQSKRHNPYVRILETAAIACSQPYFNGDSQSWVSGTFTNWNEYLQQRQNNEVSPQRVDDYGPGYITPLESQGYNITNDDNNNEETPEGVTITKYDALAT